VFLAKRYFEATGCLVETAPNVVRWVPKTVEVSEPGAIGVGYVKDTTMVPRSQRHDFFGIWDVIAVRYTGRCFVQVTDSAHMSARRQKVLASRFPCTGADQIWGYKGRGWFRVWRGPEFDAGTEELVKVPPKAKK
jgi:hypothetical protein